DLSFEPSPAPSSDDTESQTESRGPTEWSTPPRNIDGWSARPPAGPLAQVSFHGHRCSLSLFSNANCSVQGAHVVAHASDLRVTAGFEKFMVIPSGKLNLDRRSNRVFLDANLHIAYDHGKWAFIPLYEDLSRMNFALRRLQLQPAPGETEPPSRNSEGFTPHEEVFPRKYRDFHIVPFSTWGNEIPITRKVHVDQKECRVYLPPWTNPDDTPALPKATLHCSPYFITYKAYLALKQPGVHAPLYPREVDLVIKNGKLM
ncbi:hypothetical protein BD626DRAFT_389147, partial [Schizophyllum amplum]